MPNGRAKRILGGSVVLQWNCPRMRPILLSQPLGFILLGTKIHEAKECHEVLQTLWQGAPFVLFALAGAIATWYIKHFYKKQADEYKKQADEIYQ
jgi:hypothetical protein